MIADHAKALRELLVFYSEAGVDAVLDETPTDRFAEPANQSRSTAAPADTPVPDREPSSIPAPPAPRAPRPTIGPSELARRGAAPAPPAPDSAIMAAREAARSATDLDALRTILDGFEGCALRTTAKQLVFADGNPQARIMFVGEAPGRDEDIEGLPFVGRSGKLLDRMMAAIGLDRSSAYIANIVPWRPPGNRTPTPQESAICLPFMQRQIELADPDILVCLGGPSAQTLLGLKEGITKSRGRWFKYNSGKREIRALPTFHPAFLLRSPLQKRLAWRDFLAIKKVLAD
jgi:uracil-DNA glycosylase family 4